MSERRTASALAYLHPDFCFIMDDDSMECAGIRAGDIVAFTACDHAEDSQIVAVQTDSSVLLHVSRLYTEQERTTAGQNHPRPE